MSLVLAALLLYITLDKHQVSCQCGVNKATPQHATRKVFETMY